MSQMVTHSLWQFLYHTRARVLKYWSIDYWVWKYCFTMPCCRNAPLTLQFLSEICSKNFCVRYCCKINRPSKNWKFVDFLYFLTMTQGIRLRRRVGFFSTTYPAPPLELAKGHAEFFLSRVHEISWILFCMSLRGLRTFHIFDTGKGKDFKVGRLVDSIASLIPQTNHSWHGRGEGYT